MKHFLTVLAASALLAVSLAVASPVQGSLVHPQKAGACAWPYYFDHLNQQGISVYDYGQQRYTTIWFYNFTYTDGCNDYQWLARITVADGSVATLTPVIDWWWPHWLCGEVMTDVYNQGNFSSLGVWSNAANEVSPAQGFCGSHDSDTNYSTAHSLSFYPQTVSANVYS
jgi:hypothetical protein